MGLVGFPIPFAVGEARGCGSLHGKVLRACNRVGVEGGAVELPCRWSGALPACQNVLASDRGCVPSPQGVGHYLEIGVLTHGAEGGPAAVSGEEILDGCCGGRPVGGAEFPAGGDISTAGFTLDRFYGGGCLCECGAPRRLRCPEGL